MNKELLDMSNCPEIQGPWEPKVGDRVWHKEYGRHIVVGLRMLPPDGFGVDLNGLDGYFDITLTDDIIYIPRIEDVLEQLVPKYCSHWDVALHELLTHYRYAEWDMPIKAGLAMIMHIESGKTWNGKAWVKKA